MKVRFAKLFLIVFLFSPFLQMPLLAQQPRTCVPGNQCQDCTDNDKDGKADYDGNDTVDTAGKFVEPDPSCFSPNATVEQKDDVTSTIIPCTDKCTFSDVFKLLNNVLSFFITTLLIPIFIIIVMYAGFRYLKAGASGSGKADIKAMLGHIIGGIILILCAWLIVHTIMTTLLNDDFKQSGVEFLGN